MAWLWASLKYAGTVITAFVTGLAERGFGVLLQLPQDESGDFRRREGFFAEFDTDDGFTVFGDAEREEFQFFLNVGDAAAHEALDRVDGAIGMIDQFLAGGVADDDVAGG